VRRDPGAPGRGASVDLEREVELLRFFLVALGDDECLP
jgi:hypothetical protein